MGNQVGCCAIDENHKVKSILDTQSCCSVEATDDSQSGATPSLPSAAKGVIMTNGCHDDEQAQNGGIDSDPDKHKLPKEHSLLKNGRYAMDISSDGVVGEGSLCTCRRGVVVHAVNDKVESRQEVAIKLYKKNKKNSEKHVGAKFDRQVKVLLELAEPFQEQDSEGVTLRGTALEGLDVRTAFVPLVDYSCTGLGVPGIDPVDLSMYCIMELAEYSMKDYVTELHESGKRSSPEQVRSVVNSMLTAVAALHAKGFAHLDIKPENLMWSRGHWKLIDVDGCQRFGDRLSLEDETISFSAVYCAPEWADFVLDPNHGSIEVKPSLDAWSIGVTMTELVLLHPHYHSQFMEFMRQESFDNREATVSFLEWLRSLSQPYLADGMNEAEPGFQDMLTNMLLVPDKDKRSPIIECLDHQYLKSGSLSCHSRNTVGDLVTVRRRLRPPVDDDGSEVPEHAGLLWKLNQEGDPLNRDH